MNFDEEFSTELQMDNEINLDDVMSHFDAQQHSSFETGNAEDVHIAEHLVKEVTDLVAESAELEESKEHNSNRDEAEADDEIDVSLKENCNDVPNYNEIEGYGVEVHSEEHTDANMEKHSKEALSTGKGDADPYNSDCDSNDDQAIYPTGQNIYLGEKTDEPTVVRQSHPPVEEDDDYEIPNDEKSEVFNYSTVDVRSGVPEDCEPSPSPLEPAVIDSDENVVDEEVKISGFDQGSSSMEPDVNPTDQVAEPVAVIDISEERPSCFKCEAVVCLNDELAVMDQCFHKHCFRCTKCNILLATETYRAGEDGQLYCEPHYIELCVHNSVSSENETTEDPAKHSYSRTEDEELPAPQYTKNMVAKSEEDPVKHSYSRTEEEELPAPQYTKNMVAKFQQVSDSTVSSPSTSTTVGKLKIETVYKPESNTEVSPSTASGEVLPPSGSAKRLVEKWSSLNPDGTRTSEKSPLSAQMETHYAPNTAKSIAAKFSAGLFDEQPSSTQSGDNSSKSSPDGVFAVNATGSHGDELPIQGQARGLIAKFSAMHA